MSSESSPTASPSTGGSPPPPDGSPPPPSSTSPPPPTPTSYPPPASTPPPPTTPPATPPPSNPTTPPPGTPPPAPPTSSPPPPTSTPPPATPVTTPSPPPPVPSASTPPATPTPVTPSPPAPAGATPAQNPPATPAVVPPQEKPISPVTPRPPGHSPDPPSSGGGGDRSSGSSDSPSSSGNQPALDGGVIAGIVVGGVVIIALLMVIICLICSNRKKKKPQYYMDPARQPNGTNQYYNQDQGQWHSSQNPNGGGWGSVHPNMNMSGELSAHPMPASANMGGITQFSYDELAAATGGFCEANLLGQGGFGFVHKGVLPDRREVAVKSLKSGSGQGEREFQAEVEIISRVHHRHLVSLVGYCIAPHSKLLVYEYVANKTMEYHLHGEGRPVLDWPTRLRIAIGSAKGLAYLHEDCLPRIIHRDIKAANILIDNNFEAMVADFGLAKLTTDNNTHVSTRVMGTFGYLAPEYASSGKLSEKSDVFSFGVMLLELVTGRRPIDLTNITMEDSLVDWARPLLTKALEDGNYEELVDPRLQGNYVHHELARMAACAAASIRHSARKRPKMSQIVRALEGDSSLDDLNEGVKPGQSSAFGTTSDIYDTQAYNADMMKFKQMIMSSQEMDSSDYTASSHAHSMDMVDKKPSES